MRTINASTESPYFRTVPFALDAHSGTLGRQRNAADAPNREIATDRSFQGASFNGKLKTVYYGTYQHKPACLLHFDFNFFFLPGNTPRFKSAEIAITISTDSPTGTQPVVKSFAPRKVYGKVHTETRTWSFGLPMPSMTLGTDITSPALEKIENKFEREHRMEIRGFVSEKNTKVRWTIAENPKQKTGIPDRFPCAFVVEYDGNPFRASVNVKAKTDMAGLAVKAAPWDRDDPILLRPGVTLGEQMRDPQLENMTVEDWEELVGIKDDSIVCLHDLFPVDNADNS